MGDEVQVDSGLLRVERVDGSRIVRLRFISPEPDANPAAAGDAGDEEREIR
jgi:hypothetical protein